MRIPPLLADFIYSSDCKLICEKSLTLPLPVGTIDEDTAAEVIPEMDSTVLVYCRSGNRSKTASSALAELGYTNIYEFGGINTWPYETES